MKTFWMILAVCGALGEAALPLNAAVSTAPGGSDGTGTTAITLMHAGSPSTYSSVELALTNAVSGDVVTVPTGVYFTTNGWYVPVGVKLFGQGRPTLINYHTNNPLPYAIWTSSSSWVEGFYISNTVSASSGAKQVGVGASSVQENVAFTNITLKDIKGDGYSDFFFYKAKKNVGVREYNCYYTAQWDARVIVADSGAEAGSSCNWEMYGCTSIIYTNQGAGIGYTHCFGVDCASGTFGSYYVNVVGGLFVSTNNGYGFCACFLDSGDTTGLPGVVNVSGATFISDGTPIELDSWANKSFYAAGCSFPLSAKILQDDTPLVGNAGTVQITTTISQSMPRGLPMVDSFGGPNIGTVWTNKWGADGGLSLGSTNPAGKANILSSGNFYHFTNSGSGTFVDFSKNVYLLQTNANFVFRGFLNVSNSLDQVTEVIVTNSSAATINVQAPAGTGTNSGQTWTIGAAGMAVYRFRQYGGLYTNAVPSVLK